MAGPADPSDFPAWFESVQAFRQAIQDDIQYNGSAYDNSGVVWARDSNSVHTQVMTHDRFLYDDVNHAWTVAGYLDDLESRYGGPDSVLIWHSYPNMGVDDRNQYDMLRALPGYPDRLREAVQEFNNRGVRVLIPYNPWDDGTRPEGRPDEVSMADAMKDVLASGFNGDTMKGIPASFFYDSWLNGSVLLQPELGSNANCSMLEVNVASWGENLCQRIRIHMQA
jgi:iron(II)-dependent oxidoreductase